MQEIRLNLLEDYMLSFALVKLGISMCVQLSYVEQYGKPYSEELELELAKQQLIAYGQVYKDLM